MGMRERHLMELLIRYAELNDLEMIRTLYAQPNVIAGTLQIPFPSLELWRERLSDLEPDARTLVAVADGTVVGHLGIHPAYRPRRAHATVPSLRGSQWLVRLLPWVQMEQALLSLPITGLRSVVANSSCRYCPLFVFSWRLSSGFSVDSCRAFP